MPCERGWRSSPSCFITPRKRGRWQGSSTPDGRCGASSSSAIARHGIASTEELTHLAADWEEWAKDPGAFFAFAWCRVLAWS